jgi:hypothetical protein
MATLELSAEERTARQLVEADRTADYAVNGHNAWGQMLRSAILACWASAMTADRLAIIGAAIHCQPVPAECPEAAQKELSRMVRAKVLRSYLKGGRRLYEVNF